jgi:hypothetical protein
MIFREKYRSLISCEYMQKANTDFMVSFMDRKARFLLASKVSEARDINATVVVVVFKEALHDAQGNMPQQY